MRIAFVGKGGSGKSTICAAFIQHMRTKASVLAVDADVNRHLPALLGFDTQPQSLALCQDDVFKYLKGTRTDLEKFVSTTPPSHLSNMVRPLASDPFVQRYALTSADKKLSLLSVGKYEQNDVGDSCYHGKLYTLAALMHHMIDQPDEWVIADSTAGTDGLATSLYYAYDAYVYVVEPTVKSIQVYKDFLEATKDNAKPVYVIVNKAEEQDMAFVHQHIDPQNILAVVPHSNELRRYEQGDAEAFSRFCASVTTQMSTIETILSKITRDYGAYYNQLISLHNQLAASWANVYYQATLDFTPEAGFDYAACFAKELKQAA